ncbi:sporulation protein YabP [Alicyclobacillaceae bacterium I2511]|jgi:sporulation protein YabP|nr:sporulation protein YabP [Alicyclobacillaceae bacterium I2511]
MMQPPEQHDLTIKDRKVVEVSGVASVESFDATAFALVTSGGPLIIQGSGLHMKHLDLQTGVVIIEGTVASVAYGQEQKKKHLTQRLFR